MAVSVLRNKTNFKRASLFIVHTSSMYALNLNPLKRNLTIDDFDLN